MPKTWLSLKVEILRGRGVEYWPPPGRLLVVGPRHTFDDLALAINQALGRWDLSHLSRFELADGSVVTDEETIAESDSLFVPGAAGHDIAGTKVTKLVDPGDSFRYVFDFGDEWTHACTVDVEKVDPAEVYGVVPDAPAAYWGWGELPDQYGRRWADDDGENLPPGPPPGGHPMLNPAWPELPLPRIDLAELRTAMFDADGEAIVAAIRGRNVRSLLQQVGEALEVAIRAGSERARVYGADLLLMLSERGWEGDDILEDDLGRLVRGSTPEGRVVAASLDEVADKLEGSMDEEGGYLDLQTGEVIHGFMTEPDMVGEDAAVDIEDEPDRWLHLPRLGSHDGWQDMATYAAAVTDPRLRERLERDLEGKGAFRRFKDSIYEAGRQEEWFAFSNERQMGRARAFLADQGIRVLP